MYKIIIANCLNDSILTQSTYTESFFKDEQEAGVVALRLAEIECNKLNLRSDLKYTLHLNPKNASCVAMIATPGKRFYIPVKKYYIEEIDDKDAMVSLFDSISNVINSTVLDYYIGLSNVKHHLYEFTCSVINLIYPYLRNSRTFDVVDIDSEVKYWIAAYKEKYTGSILVKECCEAIVFNLFCVIDGASSENDFTIEKTAFNEALQKIKLHHLWCEYLKEKKQ